MCIMALFCKNKGYVPTQYSGKLDFTSYIDLSSPHCRCSYTGIPINQDCPTFQPKLVLPKLTKKMTRNNYNTSMCTECFFTHHLNKTDNVYSKPSAATHWALSVTVQPWCGNHLELCNQPTCALDKSKSSSSSSPLFLYCCIGTFY